MKKYSIFTFILLAIILITSTISCSSESSTTTPSQTTSTTPKTTTTLTTKPAGPVYGGVLRQIDDAGPRVLSYLPEMGPWDEGDMLPATEKLLEFDENHNLVPFLAESYKVDTEKLTATFVIKKGIKFHDGSDLNAEAVVWNYQLGLEKQRILFSSKIKSVEKVDDYTIVFHLEEYNNMFDFALGWVPIFSKVAWDKAGGGDFEKSREWARANCVATGPFKLKEYMRDDHMTWVKNENYWQEGKPYLDGIEVQYIPESVTAAAAMLSDEADMWTSVPVKNQSEMVEKGFIRQEQALGAPLVIYFDLNKNPDSVFQDIRLRQAVEYAIDRPAITKALGFGYGRSLLALQCDRGWGYDPNYEGRPYNPDKARELIKEAGYPDGLKVKMLVQAGNTDLTEAVKRYLDEVGMEIELDMADEGRFQSAAWKDGWDGLCLFSSGSDPDPLMVILVMFGPHPMNLVAGFYRSPELLALGETALQQYTLEGKMLYAKKLVRQIADEVALVPLYEMSMGYIIKPYVHTTYGREMSVARRTYDEWMDPH